MTQIELQAYTSIVHMSIEMKKLNSNLEQLITILSNSNNELPQ